MTLVPEWPLICQKIRASKEGHTVSTHIVLCRPAETPPPPDSTRLRQTEVRNKLGPLHSYPTWQCRDHQPPAVTGEHTLISETVTKPLWRCEGTSVSPHPMESEFPTLLGKVIHRLKMR